jgi:hypothetical protein
MSVRDEKEDGFIAAVTNHTVLGMDNADTRVKWLEDDLATYATGVAYRLRRYFTTNEEVSYLPRAAVMISSRDPHFNRPDVAERLLPLHCRRPDAYVDEQALFEQLQRDRGAIFGGLLNLAGQIADTLEDVKPPRLPFRMADFATFGWVFSKTSGNADQWVAILQKLERAQARFAAEGNSISIALRELLKSGGEDAVRDMPISELYKACAGIADAERLPFPKSSIAFGRHLTAHHRALEIGLGVRVVSDYGHAGGRSVSIYPEGR